MTNINRALFWLLLASLAAVSCNDPSNLGAELISDQISEFEYTDTVTISAVNVPQDSIFTYTNNDAAQPFSYLVGSIDDPVFGKSKASLYVDFLLNITTVAGSFGLENAELDSLVLSLSYDTLRTYGDTLNIQTLEFHRILDSMERGIEFYYSDESFETELTPVGTNANFLPRPKSRIFSDADDTIGLPAHMRIRLDDALGNELMNYTEEDYASSENFKAKFRGLKISTPLENSNILGFNVNSSESYMRMYYHTDTDTLSITFLIGQLSVKFNEFEHDYAGAEVEPFINNRVLSDSLLFPQGMSGLNVKLDFPYLKDLGEAVINKAELEFTMAYLPGDDTLSFYPTERLSLNFLAENGNYLFIPDINEAVLVGDLEAFGGSRNLEDENGVQLFKYRMNISNYLQDILECTDEFGQYIPNCLGISGFTPQNSSMYLQVYLKNQFASRTVIYGPGHSEYPVKLHLTYTKQ